MIDDIIDWKCPVCGKMVRSFDIVCPYCALQLQKDKAYIELMNAIHEKVVKQDDDR